MAFTRQLKSLTDQANEKRKADKYSFAPENSMKRMGIVCCSLLALVLLAVPLTAQQSPSTTSPAAPSVNASAPEEHKAVTN